VTNFAIAALFFIVIHWLWCASCIGNLFVIMSFSVLLLAVYEFLFCLTEVICVMSELVTGSSL